MINDYVKLLMNNDFQQKILYISFVSILLYFIDNFDLENQIQSFI